MYETTNEFPSEEKIKELQASIANLQLSLARSAAGALVITISTPEHLTLLLEHLKNKWKYNFLVDILGIDNLRLRHNNPRFEVVYQLLNMETNQRLFVKVRVPEDQPIPTVSSLWKCADWLERETWDMFGIKFSGHPDLRRILTHNDFVGHPLRKDFPADSHQPLPMTPLDDILEQDKKRMLKSIDDDLLLINIGPAHPATHGTLRLMALVDGGEVIRECDTEIGYLHRCFEKMCETHNYNQIMPYTDRLNYCSSGMNNNGFAMAVEKLIKIEAPPRAQMLRMIIDEFSRIIDHLVCVGTNGVDLGAISGFLYLFHERENVYNLFEKLCGARLTVSLTRIGGMGFDLPEGWTEEAFACLISLEKSLQEFVDLVIKNSIFIGRTKGVGKIDTQTALSYGFTGPCLRATGLAWDLRKTNPYYFYNEVDFDIPVGVDGDTYERNLVRIEEIRQSIKIIRWCLNNIPEGRIKIDDKLVSLPDKKDVYGNIEGLMNHFMLIINGVQPPQGEVYGNMEAANGELGFYIVSDGTGTPYRVKCRAPCFQLMSAFGEMVTGGRIADAIATLGSLNIVAGELDR